MARKMAKERQFKFDPKRGVPESARQKFEFKYVQKRQQIELNLAKGPGELTRVLLSAKSELSKLDQQLAQLEHATAQAKCDMSVC